ncbi:MAG: hypothetical protein ACYCVN_05325 [Acidimicrobiales bacterium]
MTAGSTPASGGVTDDPIRIGTLLYTLVEPHRGHEVDYNRWYERDHFYAGCQIGAYNFAGARFVATAELKELRLPTPDCGGPPALVADPQIGSYLGLYYVLDGHHDEWNRWAVDQVNVLHRAGRMFEQRDHVHTGLYRYEWELRREEDGVPAELTLDHRFGGLVSVFVELAEGATPEMARNVVAEEVLARLQPGTPLATVLGFTTLPLLADAPGDVPRDAAAASRLLLLCFLDEEPSRTWHEVFDPLPAAVSRTGLGRLAWASPFIGTVPGTDRFTDQLWRQEG